LILFWSFKVNVALSKVKVRKEDVDGIPTNKKRLSGPIDLIYATSP
jgi:hypothetical protein